MARTGLKVRVSDGFKRPSRRENMLSEHGRIWPQPGTRWFGSPLMYSPPAFFHPRVSHTNRRGGGLNVKMDFLTPPSLLTPSFFPLFLRTRSLDRQNSLSFAYHPLLFPSRRSLTHVNNTSRCGPASAENEGETRRRSTYVSKSLCASCGERRCVAVARSP